MPSYVTPKRATEYIFYISLVSQANTKIFQANPTIAAGDFKVSIDGGAEANLATLPVVTPAGSKRVKVTVSIAETTSDNTTITCSDASGAEWCDLTINIQTSVRQIDDLATLAWPAAWDAEVQSEVQDAIEANNLDHLAGTAASIPAIPAGTYIDQIMDDGTAVYDRTTDSLQAQRDNIGDGGSALTTLPANVVQISGDTTAADNAELFFDGTGYAGTNNVIPTVTNLTNAPTAGDLTATMKTSVNAEVLDVLNVDTFTEIGQEAPAATQTIRKMIAYLYKAFRNRKTQTATTLSIFDDAGTTVDHKATISDDGTTYVHGEIATGP